MYTLGIESTCDETSAAILKNSKVLSNVTISSLRQHKQYGGVVPEIATRAHLKNINRVVEQALEQAQISLKKVDLISVSSNPGLIGAVVVGLNFAKALAISINKPLIGVDHLHAHFFAPFLDQTKRIEFPFLGCVFSGGHTEIYRVNDFDDIKIVGRACDDACGEVFDKVARAFGLGYPGGPIIDRLFKEEFKEEFKFKCGRRGYDLSFSGIKTALIYKKIELSKNSCLDRDIEIKLISSFQHSVVWAIVTTIVDAAKDLGIKRIVCGGGVVANTYLRSQLTQINYDKIKVFLPHRKYTTDNAAMVAGLGFYLYNRKGIKSNLKLKAGAN